MFDDVSHFAGKIFPEELPEAPGFSLSPGVAGRYAVRVWGRFAPGWLGGFTAGLAHERLNILSGAARKLSPALWYALFEVDGRNVAARPEALDFLAMAGMQGPRGRDEQITLDSFCAEPGAAGSLLVTITAEDQLGFLTAILKHFAFLSLFPAELTVDTYDGQVQDRFWLKGVGGMPPSSEAISALRERLTGLSRTSRQPA